MVQPYRTQTAMFDGREYRWEGTTAAWANASRNSSDGSRFVEFVTSLNNPDALLRKPVLRGSAVIADHAYYWPHFTHRPTRTSCCSPCPSDPGMLAADSGALRSY